MRSCCGPHPVCSRCCLYVPATSQPLWKQVGGEELWTSSLVLSYPKFEWTFPGLYLFSGILPLAKYLKTCKNLTCINEFLMYIFISLTQKEILLCTLMLNVTHCEGCPRLPRAASSLTRFPWLQVVCRPWPCIWVTRASGWYRTVSGRCVTCLMPPHVATLWRVCCRCWCRFCRATTSTSSPALPGSCLTSRVTTRGTRLVEKEIASSSFFCNVYLWRGKKIHI